MATITETLIDKIRAVQYDTLPPAAIDMAKACVLDGIAVMLAGVGDTSARAAFVIGRDGVVKYAEQTATPKDLPNFAAVKAALAR